MSYVLTNLLGRLVEQEEGSGPNRRGKVVAVWSDTYGHLVLAFERQDGAIVEAGYGAVRLLPPGRPRRSRGRSRP